MEVVSELENEVKNAKLGKYVFFFQNISKISENRVYPERLSANAGR